MTYRIVTSALATFASLIVATTSAFAQNGMFGDFPTELRETKTKKIKPKTTTLHTVDRQDQSLQEVINAADPGDTIELEVNDYQLKNGLVLDKSIKIVGKERDGFKPVLQVSTSGSSCLTQTGQNVSTEISNVIFIAGNVPCLNVRGGTFEMKESHVYQDSHAPYGLSKNSHWVPDSLVSVNGGSVVLSANMIMGGKDAAVSVSNDSNRYGSDSIKLTGNIISNSEQHGVFVEGSSALLEFTGNTISNNRGAGIYNNGQGNKTLLAGNMIMSNKKDGVFVGKNAGHTTLENNMISGNKEDGIEVHGGMLSLLAGNTINTAGRKTCKVNDAIARSGSVWAHTQISPGVFNDTMGQDPYRNRRGCKK